MPDPTPLKPAPASPDAPPEWAFNAAKQLFGRTIADNEVLRERARIIAAHAPKASVAPAAVVADLAAPSEIVAAIEALLSLPNVENRVGPWRDVNDAVRRLKAAWKAGGLVAALARGAMATTLADAVVECRDAIVAYRNTKEDSDEEALAEERCANADKARDAALAEWRGRATGGYAGGEDANQKGG